jgi:Na+/melibiose symporter-like transporter
MLTFGFSMGSFYFVAPDRISLVVLMLLVAGAGSGCGAAVGPSMLADAIDWDELRSGERKEGAYSAAWGFAVKLSNATIILLTGIGLEAFGFQAKQEQSEAAKLGLRVLFSAPPLVMYALGAWLLGRYALGANEHAAIREVLDGRRRGGETS